MSDSDDTDYLLLIPPNFFGVSSDQDEISPKRSNVDREIVDDLLSQVSNLENRVTAIESIECSLTTDLDIPSNFTSKRIIKSPYEVRNNHQDVLNWVRSNKFQYNRELSLENLNNDGFDYTRPTRFTGFNHNVEFLANSQEELVEMTSPLKGQDGTDLYNPQKKLELTEVDRLLKEMEVTQRDIENKLRLREQETELMSGDGKYDTVRKIDLLGENIGSVPDLGFGVRNMFAESSKVNEKSGGTSDPKSAIEDPCSRKSYSLLGSSNDIDSSKLITYTSHDYNLPPKSINTISPNNDKSRYTPSVRRKLPLVSQDLISKSEIAGTEKLASPLKNVYNTPSKSEKRFSDRLINKPPPSLHSEPAYNIKDIPGEEQTGDVRSIVNSRPILNRRTEQFPPSPPHVSEKLLSLNELWKGDDENMLRDPLKLRQKWEEEKYRRLHLENAVQNLQKKVLEEQEKLAVAIQVDEKKDQVIEKVTDAWKKMVDHWKQIEEYRHSASQALLTERAMTKRSQEELSKRVFRWEREVSQALDLAAGFKNKAEGLEKDLLSVREEYNDKLQESEDRITAVELILKQKEQECTQIQEKLGETLHELHEERKVSDEAKLEIARLENSIGRLEAELLVIKEQRELLSMRLKEETARVTLLEQQKQSLEASLSDSSSKYKELDERYKVAKKHLDSVKSELKLLYQSQLESVVREKLAEFQSQLETARDDMRHQLDSELAAARELSRKQQQSLVNSHVVEMRRLESIHKEEMTILERRLAEAESTCTKLEQAKRDVAHKLHKVMENQWQQALDVITGELSLRQVESDYGKGPMQGVRSEDMVQTVDHESPCKEMPAHPAAFQFSNQNQLLKYIEVMLDKHPGRPVDTLDSSVLHESSEMLDESTLQSLNWNHRLRPATQGGEMRIEGDKDSRKPPWK